MTLCTVGACEAGEAIAYVFDEQLTADQLSADILSKAARVNRFWLVFFSGEDVSTVGSVFDRLKKAVINEEKVSRQAIHDALLKASSETFLLEIAPNILPFGWTHQQFKSHGRDLLGPLLHDEVQRQLHAARLNGPEYLITGFDERGLAHIIDQPPDGWAIDARWGWQAIGCGRSDATQFLTTIRYTRDMTVNEAIYSLCAAKFVSESAYVGRGTRIGVLRKDGSLWSMPSEPMRALWESELRAPKIPSGLDSRMPPLQSGPSMQFASDRRPVSRPDPEWPTSDS
jgi:hypothetical protein